MKVEKEIPQRQTHLGSVPGEEVAVKDRVADAAVSGWKRMWSKLNKEFSLDACKHWGHWAHWPAGRAEICAGPPCLDMSMYISIQHSLSRLSPADLERQVNTMIDSMQKVLKPIDLVQFPCSACQHRTSCADVRPRCLVGLVYLSTFWVSFSSGKCVGSLSKYIDPGVEQPV